MKTRERIVEEALTLFSRKGFAGTSVKDIAQAVGIKDASLYKHFKGKQDIFDTICTETTQRMNGLTSALALPEDRMDSRRAEETGAFYKALSPEMVMALSEKIFLFYWKDSFAARFRRMLTVEQYGKTAAAGLYRKIFMEDAMAYQTMVFSEMIKNGAFKPGDPEVVAMDFYAPIFFLLSRYDGQPEREAEALTLLKKQIRSFVGRYAVQKDKEK